MSASIVKGGVILTTTSPRTGTSTAIEVSETSSSDLDLITERARFAASGFAALGREVRANALEAIADSLDARREVLVQTADDETGLGLVKLNGELSRSIFQFRLFAEALREGSYLEAMIDHRVETVLGPAPDLRRILIPIGPVAVFGSSNFPFAFSVAGGDTASALAAGCPVVLKAHPSHPLTSLRSFDAIVAGLGDHGAPEGTVGLIFGEAAGGRLVADRSIKAVSFTGSLAGAQALQGIINEREDPIPFYGELSSLNPLVITANAAQARATEIAQGLVTSFTGSGGQLCTKPGIAFVPTGEAGDYLVKTVHDLVIGTDGQVLLNRRILDAYKAISDRLTASGAVTVVARAEVTAGADGFVAAPTLLTTTAAELSGELMQECFGPLIVLVRYEHVEELEAAIRRLPNSLTATIHAEDDEVELMAELTGMFAPICGRIIYNGFPTGLRVSWAQHHGGPWPATNSLHTSVGVTAMRRFLRPFVWQNAPQSVIPEELRDGESTMPRRIDGQLVVHT
ncbi:MAG: aldehyde dehydrogenase (NADP(+)) [Ferrimicrobium sp.]